MKRTILPEEAQDRPNDGFFALLPEPRKAAVSNYVTSRTCESTMLLPCITGYKDWKNTPLRRDA